MDRVASSGDDMTILWQAVTMVVVRFVRTGP